MLTLTRNTKSLGKHTLAAMKTLIANCLENQKHFSFFHSDPDSYLKEYCTVRIFCGRQTGHTTAALQIAHKLFDCALFVSPTSAQRDSAKHNLRSYLNGISDRVHFCLPATMQKIDGLPIGAVFVDSISFLSQEDLEKVYSHCLRFWEQNNRKSFVIVLMY